MFKKQHLRDAYQSVMLPNMPKNLESKKNSFCRLTLSTIESSKYPDILLHIMHHFSIHLGMDISEQKYELQQHNCKQN